MTEDRKPFWVKCPKCSHCWAPAYSQMEVGLFAKTVMRSACPKCGTHKGILVAKQENGKLLEPEAA